METDVIHNADCLSGMKKELDDKSINIVVTSPPYNIGVEYNSYNDSKEFGEYLDWIEEIAKDCFRVLKDDGSFFFNIGDKVSDQLKAFEVAKRISKYFKLQNTIHWIKSIAVPEKGITIGHYKPVNSERFLNNCHEYIFHFTKTGSVRLNKLAVGVPYADKSNIGRYSDIDARDRGNTWFFNYETVAESKLHPAEFPLDLPLMCIKLHGFNKNTVVLDPFMGSGTTAVAAHRLGCKYIGFEIDEHYIKLAESRLTQKSLAVLNG